MPRRLAPTPAPEQLPLEARERIREWCAKKYPRLFPQLRDQWGRARDWHLANGVLRCDWEAAFRNWLRKAHEMSARAAVDSDRPRRKSVELAPLAEVIPIRREA